MRIIGLDPGSRFYGVALLEKKGSKITYLYSDVIRLKESDLMIRFQLLWDTLDHFIKANSIDNNDVFVAMEDGFTGKNVKSADTLAKVRGFSMASFISRKIPMKTYSPREIKKALTGNGNADKIQVAKIISTLLNIKTDDLKDDETDALAIAYCHAMSLTRSA